MAALAACPEDKLLKLWEGLGYYSRVRNMQAAAMEVVEKYNGRLPESFSALLSLKGIGRYTAGAIASIAYEIPVPAVDGNVLRVISRICEDRGGYHQTVCERPGGKMSLRRSFRRGGQVILTRRSWSWGQLCVCRTASRNVKSVRCVPGVWPVPMGRPWGFR